MLEVRQVLETHYVIVAGADALKLNVVKSQCLYTHEVLPWRLNLLQRDIGVTNTALRGQGGHSQVTGCVDCELLQGLVTDNSWD